MADTGWNARTTYTGDGGTTDFVIGFAYGGDTSRVVVEVDGTTQTATTDYTFINSGNSVRFVSAPATGTDIVIRRSTPRETLLVDFGAGVPVSDTDLDNAERVGFHIGGELEDLHGRTEIIIGNAASGRIRGADPDLICYGPNDDTVFSTAFTRAKDADKGRGARVIILEGTYTLTSQLIIPDVNSFIIQGEGWDTILDYDLSANLPFIKRTSFATVMDGLQMRDFKLLGPRIRFDQSGSGAEPGDQGDGMQLFNCSELLLEHVAVFQSDKNGVALLGCTDSKIRDCRFDNTGLYGIWSGEFGSPATHSRRTTHIGCTGFECGIEGFGTSDDRAIFSGCTARRCGQGFVANPSAPSYAIGAAGIWTGGFEETAPQDSGISIMGCHLIDNTTAGLELNTEFSSIIGCFIEGNGWAASTGDPGGMLLDSRGATVQGNTVKNNTKWGIVIRSVGTSFSPQISRQQAEENIVVGNYVTDHDDTAGVGIVEVDSSAGSVPPRNNLIALNILRNNTTNINAPGVGTVNHQNMEL